MNTHSFLLCCIIIVTTFFATFVKGLTFSIDAQSTPEPFPHVWEECVGSGHASLALRRDYQEHLAQVHRDLGFKRVRFHGLFDDDMSVYQAGELTYSWFNVDQVFDSLLEMGVRPYVELSFMPNGMASGTQTLMHYKANISPPKSYDLWNALLTDFATHIIQRYTIQEIATWSFEVWNEPNCGFWAASQADYWTLYIQTHQTLKKVNSQIRVGGPVTCASAWIPDFLQICANNSIKPDFIATHEYPTDIEPHNINILTQVFTQARKQAGSLPLYYSEFNDGLYSKPAYHDTPFASAYLIKLMNDVKNIVDVLSWWTFTDIFEEGGQTSLPFFTSNGWGLLNIYGIPKPAYRAFQILHSLGTKVIQSKVINGTPESVGVYAVLSDKTNAIDILVYNVDIPTANIMNISVSIQVANLKAIPQFGTLVRVDDANANAPQAWVNMGKPLYPTRQQIEQLKRVSEFTPEKLTAKKVSDSVAQFDLNIPKWGVAVISVPL